MKTKKAKPQPTPEPPPFIVIVSNGDDWEGLYIEGELACEDHRLSPRMVLDALGMDLTPHLVSFNYLGGTVSHLPEKLADIPADAFLDPLDP